MTDLTVDEFLAHYGVKGMKWGVRKDDATSSAKSSLMDNPYVQLAKGTKVGNVTNLAVSVASVGAVAASAPVSMPVLVGGTVAARLAIKSYEAYKIFYDKHPAKILPKPSSKAMARYSVGEKIRKDLTKAHGAKKMKDLKSSSK